MNDWPEDIPADLLFALRVFYDPADPDAPEIWWQVTRDWMDRHDIAVRLDWLPELARLIAGHDHPPGPSEYQRQWCILRRWLADHGVPVPATLRRLH